MSSPDLPTPNPERSGPTERTDPPEPATADTPATAATAGNPEPPEKPVSAAPGARSLAVSRPVAAAVALVLVVAVAVAVTFGVLLAHRTATDRAGAEALATAKAYAVTVTSYQYQNLDRNFADVLDGATGEFKDQYTGASRTLRELITTAKAGATGTVLGAGISSATTDQVQVVVFVDQSITNAALAQPRTDRNRVIMTLVPRDGRWLVKTLELT